MYFLQLLRLHTGRVERSHRNSTAPKANNIYFLPLHRKCLSTRGWTQFSGHLQRLPVTTPSPLLTLLSSPLHSPHQSRSCLSGRLTAFMTFSSMRATGPRKRVTLGIREGWCERGEASFLSLALEEDSNSYVDVPVTTKERRM